ncbi:MAG: hypothetical protein ABIS01_03510, partial [Ferruginibacter sp.]
MIKNTLIICMLYFLSGCSQRNPVSTNDHVIANGQMPNLIKDIDGSLQLVYGSGDSLMSATSHEGGSSFSSPLLIDVITGLAASHTRGPQIAATKYGLTVIVCNSAGDIFSYNKPTSSSSWIKSGKVNDVDTVAKEN